MNIKQTAKEYVPMETLNIIALPKVSVDMEIFDKVVNEGEDTEFKYQYILVDEVEYRVPLSVIKQLKTFLADNDSLKFFKVVKEGEGMKTTYTVIPLMS